MKSDNYLGTKLFSIQEIPKNLITSISQEFKVYTETQAPSRKLVEKKLEYFLKSGFSILLIGERRGTGKSQLANSVKERLKKIEKPISGNLVEVNCASFDEDSRQKPSCLATKKGLLQVLIKIKKNFLKKQMEVYYFLMKFTIFLNLYKPNL